MEIICLQSVIVWCMEGCGIWLCSSPIPALNGRKSEKEGSSEVIGTSSNFKQEIAANTKIQYLAEAYHVSVRLIHTEIHARENYLNFHKSHFGTKLPNQTGRKTTKRTADGNSRAREMSVHSMRLDLRGVYWLNPVVSKNISSCRIGINPRIASKGAEFLTGPKVSEVWYGFAARSFQRMARCNRYPSQDQGGSDSWPILMVAIKATSQPLDVYRMVKQMAHIATTMVSILC